MKRTWRLIQNIRYILAISVLVGLVVGLIVHFNIISTPSIAKEIPVQSVFKENPNITDQESYWKGTIDTQLKQMNDRITELTIEVKALNCGVTEIKISAARAGGIYGLATSIIVVLGSLLGQGLWKVARKKSQK
jgi:predicted PurR-regulated permease PerM